jgi:hypothetical protein
MSDILSLKMMLQVSDFVRNSNSAAKTIHHLQQSMNTATKEANSLNNSMNPAVVAAYKNQVKTLSTELMQLGVKFGGAAATTAIFYTKIKNLTLEAGKFQTALFDINNSLNSFNSTDGKQRIDETTKAIMRQATGLHSLNSAAKAYYTISTAGLTGKNRLGKDITEMGVEYAKLYQVLSRGKLTVEEAASFIPELLAKTGASMELAFNNGSTQMERYIDMIGKAERITKLKMENMREVLDSMGASMRYAGVGFAEALTLASVQMNAGKSARDSGQTVKSMLNKLVSDSAQLTVHSSLYDSTQKEFSKLRGYNRTITQTRGFQPTVTKLFGGQEQFEALSSNLIAGVTSFNDIFALMEKNANKLDNSQRGAFNALVKYFENIDELNDKSLAGTRQQKRLLLGLSMVFGDRGKSFTDDENLTKGRDIYQRAIGDISSGNITIFDWYKQIASGLEKYREDGTIESNRKIADIIRMIFPDEIAAGGFLNVMQHRVISITDDIYDVFEDGTRKLLRDLSEHERQKAIDEKRVTSTGQVLRYRKGESVRGIEAAEYLSFAVKDSGMLAKDSYARSILTLEKSVERLKAQTDTFRVLIGEGLIAPIQSFIHHLGKFVEGFNELLKLSPEARNMAGAMMFGGLGSSAVYTGYTGAKLVGKLNQFTGFTQGKQNIVMKQFLSSAITDTDSSLETLGAHKYILTKELGKYSNVIEARATKSRLLSEIAEATDKDFIKAKRQELRLVNNTLNASRDNLRNINMVERKLSKQKLEESMLMEKRLILEQKLLTAQGVDKSTRLGRLKSTMFGSAESVRAGFDASRMDILKKQGFISAEIAGVKSELIKKQRSLRAFNDVTRAQEALKLAELSGDKVRILQAKQDLAKKAIRIKARETIEGQITVLKTKEATLMAKKVGLEKKIVSLKKKELMMSGLNKVGGAVKKIPGNLMSLGGLAGIAIAGGLISFGMKGMIKNNTYGMQDLFGVSHDGRNGRVLSEIQRIKNTLTMEKGGNVSYDDLKAGIHDKTRYDDYVRSLEAMRRARTAFFNPFGSELFANEVVLASRAGQNEEGPMYENIRNLTGMIRNEIVKGNITAGMLEDTSGAKDLWKKVLERNGIKGEQRDSYLGILEDNKDLFKSLVPSFRASEDKFTAFRQLYGEELAKQKNPLLYNIFKMLQPLGKNIHAIAMGVGVGAGLGAIFGNTGLGMLGGLLLAIYAALAMEKKPISMEQALAYVASTVGTASTVGGKVGGYKGAILAGLTAFGITTPMILSKNSEYHKSRMDSFEKSVYKAGGYGGLRVERDGFDWETPGLAEVFKSGGTSGSYRKEAILPRDAMTYSFLKEQGSSDELKAFFNSLQDGDLKKDLNANDLAKIKMNFSKDELDRLTGQDRLDYLAKFAEQDKAMGRLKYTTEEFIKARQGEIIVDSDGKTFKLAEMNDTQRRAFNLMNPNTLEFAAKNGIAYISGIHAEHNTIIKELNEKFKDYIPAEDMKEIAEDKPFMAHGFESNFSWSGDAPSSLEDSLNRNTGGLDALTKQLQEVEDQWYFDMNYSGMEQGRKSTAMRYEVPIRLGTFRQQEDKLEKQREFVKQEERAVNIQQNIIIDTRSAKAGFAFNRGVR